MNIIIKTKEEIAGIKGSCDILSRTYGEVAKFIRPGISLKELDKIAEDLIISFGGKPACKGYCGFPATLCTSVNNVVIHGIPSDYSLQDGDIMSIDSGVIFNGYYSDSAFTFGVGNVSAEAKRLMDVTQKALSIGISYAITGNRVGDIGFHINEYVRSNGYHVVTEYAGHGVGIDFHERPLIFNYGRKNSGEILRSGMVIAIEPMVNIGKSDVVTLDDKWTTVTRDGSLSAHYEHTVLVDYPHPKILTTFSYIKDNYKNEFKS